MKAVSETENFRQAEEAIAGIRFAFEGLNEPFILADRDRRIVWINSAFTEDLGYELSELYGKRTQVIYEKSASFDAQGAVRYNVGASSAIKANYRMNYRRKSGQILRSETIGWAVRDEKGEPIGFAAILRDMGEALAVEDVLSRLYAISSSQTLSGAEKIQEILRAGCEHFRMPTGIVSVVREQLYTVLYASSYVAEITPGQQFELADTYCSNTLKADQPVAVADAGQDGFDAHPCFTQMGLSAYIGVPLKVDGEIIGTLNFSSPVIRERFGEADIDVIKLFAAWIGQELGHDKAYAKLNEAATVDWLTRAYTRQIFQPELEAAFFAHEQLERKSSLVFFDLDRFKQINDLHGHGAGDAVLRAVADAVQGHLPPTAQLYRLGGEEFGVILRESRDEEGLMLAETLRSTISSLSIPVHDGALHVTASFGVARVSNEFASVDSWMRAADSALYAAKQSGRDAVCRFDKKKGFEIRTEGREKAAGKGCETGPEGCPFGPVNALCERANSLQAG